MSLRVPLRPGRGTSASLEQLDLDLDLAAGAVAENHVLAAHLAPHVASLEVAVLGLVAGRLGSSSTEGHPDG